MGDRYKHQIAIEDIGIDGQTKLSNSSVLVIGAGGLGTFVSSFLASMGIGKLGIVDFDKVEKSNLTRQILYSEENIGKPKASILAKRLGELNSEIQIEGFLSRIEDESNTNLFREYDIICDCTDNLNTRMAIDRFCHSIQKPLVYAAVGGWEGYVTVLHAKNKIGLSDVLPLEEYAMNKPMNCSNFGIIATTCSIAGSMQANEIIKVILGLNNNLDGYLMCFNSAKNVYRKFKILKNTVEQSSRSQ